MEALLAATPARGYQSSQQLQQQQQQQQQQIQLQLQEQEQKQQQQEQETAALATQQALLRLQSAAMKVDN